MLSCEFYNRVMDQSTFVALLAYAVWIMDWICWLWLAFNDRLCATNVFVKFESHQLGWLTSCLTVWRKEARYFSAQLATPSGPALTPPLTTGGLCALHRIIHFIRDSVQCECQKHVVFPKVWKNSTRRGIITRPPSFKRHNLVNIWFIKISGNIVEGMLSPKIWK